VTLEDALKEILRNAVGPDFVDPKNVMSAVGQAKTELPTRGRGYGWNFLPPVPKENYIAAYALFGANKAVSSSVNAHYAAAALVDIGEPSLVAAEAWRDEADVRELRQYVERGVEPLPQFKATLPELGGDRGRMLTRVLLEDLTGGYPYQGGLRFARHVLTELWVARQYLPLLAHAVESGHPFLRRNAVYTLASLVYVGDPEARGLLRQVVEQRRDLVAWMRAARILADARDPKVGEILTRQLPDKDPMVASFILRQIGHLGYGAAGPALLRTSLQFDADLDLQWAFLEALARLPKVDAALLRRADELADRSGAQPKGKKKILRDLAWVVLDRADGGRRIADLVKASAGGTTLEGFSASTKGFIAEHLARTGWEGLKEIAQDMREEPLSRIRAVSGGPWKSAHAEWLAGLAEERRNPTELRAAAALKVHEIEPARGCRLLTQLVEAYPDGFRDEVTDEAERAVAVCILALGKDLSDERLAKTLRGALDLREKNGMRKQAEFVELLTGLLAARGEEPARPAIDLLLQGKVSVYRGHAALALSYLPSDASLKAVVDLLADPDPFVRQCAAFGLEKHRGAAADCDWWNARPDSRTRASREVRRLLGIDP